LARDSKLHERVQLYGSLLRSDLTQVASEHSKLTLELMAPTSPAVRDRAETWPATPGWGASSVLA
jgi:hypothetical protein